jgi:hypothetical protein
MDDLFGVGGACGGLIAHHEKAQGGQRHQETDVQGSTAPGYGVIVLGKGSHSHETPLSSTSYGIASTLTRSHAITPRSALRHGATPTPQFPISTLVTPCEHEDISRGSYEICAS